MANISSPGIGSGLDINGIVSQLVAAESQGPTTRLDRREADLQVRLSAYGTLKGAVSQFQSSLANLKNTSSYEERSVNTSDSDVLGASATSSAVPASYDIDVIQLADQNRLSTDPTNNVNAQLTEVTDVLGTGTLTFKFGTTDYDSVTDTYNSFTQNSEKASSTITITDGSLQGIRDAVNEADIGVTASIIFDGAYQRLTFSSDDSGAANGLQIVAVDDDGNDTDAAGLSMLAFNDADGGTTNLAQNVAAQDSIVQVNGITVTHENNALKDVIDGITLDLTSIGNSSLTVALDSEAASTAINAFISNYNGLMSTISSLTSYDAETGEAGQLNGDSIVRGLESQVKRILSDPINSGDGAFNILSDVGITSNAVTGMLEIDESKLSTAIENSVDDVIGLFAAYARPTDKYISFDSSSETTQEGSYGISIDSFATQGSLVASAAANLTITSDTNDTLSLSVDGVATSITLTAGTYTAPTLAAEIQSQINASKELVGAESSVVVSESAGILSIISNRYGSASKVDITGGNGRADLVGASTVNADGSDVSGSINGATATGSGQYLTGTGAADGLKVLIEGTTLGDRGTISFSRGFAERFDSYLDGLINSKGTFESTIGTLKTRIEGVDSDRVDLSRRLESIEKRIRTQFLSLDLLISQLQSTGNYLTRQLEALPNLNSRRR